MNFFNAISACLKKYAVFEGRAGRPEYWYFELFQFIGGMALSAINDGISLAFGIVMLLPALTVGCRRLHDIGRSGWWQLLIFIPIIGWIVLIFWNASPGNLENNQYGEPLTHPT